MWDPMHLDRVSSFTGLTVTQARSAIVAMSRVNDVGLARVQG